MKCALVTLCVSQPEEIAREMGGGVHGEGVGIFVPCQPCDKMVPSSQTQPPHDFWAEVLCPIPRLAAQACSRNDSAWGEDRPGSHLPPRGLQSCPRIFSVF